MGMFSRFFVIFAGLSMTLQAAQNEDFKTIREWPGLFEQYEFQQLLRRTFILGEQPDSRQPEAVGRGLIANQKFEIEKLEELLEFQSVSQDPGASKLIETQLQRVFRLDRAMIEHNLDFRFKMGANSKSLLGFYRQALERLPSEIPKIYEQVIRALASEIDRKTFEIHYPLISAFVEPSKRRGQFPLSREQLQKAIEEKFPTAESARLRELLLILFDGSQKYFWEPDWEFSSRPSSSEDQNLNGLAWARREFAEKHPELLLDRNNAIEALSKMIDEEISENERFLIRATLSQIQNEHWARLGPSHFAYYRLDEGFRNLISAVLFPDLPIKISRAIFESRFFELSIEEQILALQMIYPLPVDLNRMIKQISEITLDQTSQILGVHEILVSDFLDSQKPHSDVNPPARSHSLIDGTLVPDIASAKREKRRALLEENKPPNFWNTFQDWANEEFFPYEGYWTDETRRFADQLQKRKLIRAQVQRIEGLKIQFEKAKTDDERTQILREMSLAVSSFDSDPASPAVYMATFVSGLAPKTSRDILSSIADLGTGAGCLLLSRFVGGRIVVSVVGIYGLYSLYGLGHSIAVAPSFEDRLSSIEVGGESARAMTLFGAGYWGARSTLPFEPILRLRKIHKIRTEILKWEMKIAERRREISKLQSDLAQITEKIPEVESRMGVGSRVSQNLHTRAREIQFQIAQKESGIVSNAEGLLEFYIRRIAIESLRLVALIKIPVRTSALEAVSEQSLFQRFRRSQNLGIIQYEQLIQKLRVKEAAETSRSVLDEARPRSFWDRQAFETAFERFQKSQRKIGDSLAKLEGNLESLRSGKPKLSEAEVTRISEHSLENLIVTAEELTSATAESQSLSRGSAYYLNQLRALENSSPTISKLKAHLFKMEGWRESIRSRFSESQVEYPWKPSGDHYTRRFFSENYLRLEQEWNYLCQLERRLRTEAEASRQPLSEHGADRLKKVRLVLDNGKRSLESLRPSFQSYFD